jgi:triphosphoribosyl-dephospho-CoA synthetase
MEHPFVGSLEDKTMEELMDSVSSLSKKLSWASSMGNYTLANQIQMVLESYRREVGKRQAEMFDTNTHLIKGKIDIN